MAVDESLPVGEFVGLTIPPPDTSRPPPGGRAPEAVPADEEAPPEAPLPDYEGTRLDELA